MQKYPNGADLLEKVITSNDLAGLSSLEKVQHIRDICESLGLNPLTKPIQLMKFQGKEVAYFSKDATEQLRKLNKISLSIKETKIIDDLYIVIVEATSPDGRKDSSTGVITISGIKGDAKANALMKCETKAKRRATLSICGLGFIDESEVDYIPDAVKIDIVNEPTKEIETDIVFVSTLDLKNDLKKIKDAKNIDELQKAFTCAAKYWQKRKDLDALKAIIIAKDQRKGEIDVIEYQKEIDAKEENNE